MVPAVSAASDRYMVQEIHCAAARGRAGILAASAHGGGCGQAPSLLPLAESSGPRCAR